MAHAMPIAVGGWVRVGASVLKQSRRPFVVRDSHDELGESFVFRVRRSFPQHTVNDGTCPPLPLYEYFTGLLGEEHPLRIILGRAARVERTEMLVSEDIVETSVVYVGDDVH